MYSVAFGILNNREDAEDAVMDAMSRILSNLDKFAHLSDRELLALVTAYTRNTSIDIYKKNKRGASEDIEECFDLSDDRADVEDAILESDRIEKLYRYLESLPYIYSQTFMLKYYFGYTDSEIAKAMKADKNTVRKRLTRVRKKLMDNANSAGFGEIEFLRKLEV